MRRMAELYGAWIFGVLCTCGLAYWLYRHNGIPSSVVTDLVSTDDTDDTDEAEGTTWNQTPVENIIRPRFRG